MENGWANDCLRLRVDTKPSVSHRPRLSRGHCNSVRLRVAPLVVEYRRRTHTRRHYRIDTSLSVSDSTPSNVGVDLAIPSFTTQGVIPPYVGQQGPGGAHSDMSPYVTTCLEVTRALGTSQRRLDILRGWLTHRRELRRVGITSGFQWLDGSFVEDKVPNDLDVITLFYPPHVLLAGGQAANQFLQTNNHLFERSAVRQAYMLDAFWLDFSQPPENIARQTRYWFGLFSHRRVDDLWKGMLEVPLADPNEAAAVAAVDAGLAGLPGVGP